MFENANPVHRGEGREEGYTAQVVAHSLNSQTGSELMTMHVRLPWYITPELLRHRQFSFSSRSTRAVPSAIMLKEAIENPALPVTWGKNQKGMVAGAELDEYAVKRLDREVEILAYNTAEAVRDMVDAAGVHKQTANKYLTPFLWCDVLVSYTSGANFYALRTDGRAAPEMQAIARLMADAHVESEPRRLEYGEWHTPYVDAANGEEWVWHREAGKATSGGHNWQHQRTPLFASAARCARISVRNFEDGAVDWRKDMSLAEQLMGSTPVHASPFEHVAQVVVPHGNRANGNFDAGWAQLRHMLRGNTATEFIWKDRVIR